MLPEYTRRANIGGVIGWLMITFGAAQATPILLPSSLQGLVVVALGIPLFVWGCAQYSMAKGHSPYWGAFGLLWLPGFVVLLFLPDRHKSTPAA